MGGGGSADTAVDQEIAEINPTKMMVPLEYACFISYRNSREVKGRLNDFAAALKTEIANAVDAYLPDSSIQDEGGRIVFLDRDIFSNFDFNPQQLGQGLCKSIVWIVLYTRNYLSGSLWCASELHGMMKLEAERLECIEQIGNPDFGFIAPILLTGDETEMPAALRKHKRHFLDFSGFFLRKNFTEDDDFADKLRVLLDNIGRVQQVVLDRNADICAGCNSFALVDVTEDEGKAKIEDFVEHLKAKQPPQPIN